MVVAPERLMEATVGIELRQYVALALAFDPGQAQAGERVSSRTGRMAWDKDWSADEWANLVSQLNADHPPLAIYLAIREVGIHHTLETFVAGLALAPYLGNLKVAGRLLAELIGLGLDPYCATSYTGLNGTDGGLACGRNTNWPLIVIAHLNRWGHGEASMAKLAEAMKVHDPWIDPVNSAKSYLPLLREAGVTPWERATFMALMLKGRSLAAYADPKHQIHKGWTSRWPIDQVPLPALLLAGTNESIAKGIEQNYAQIIEQHPNLPGSGPVPLVAGKNQDSILNRRKSQDAIRRRMQFIKEMEGSLGMFYGLKDTGVSDPADRALREKEGPWGSGRRDLDALWVYQFLLGDPEPDIRKAAFDGLLRVRYGDAGLGLKAIKDGGEGAYPFGIERVLLEAVKQEAWLVA